MTHGGDIYRNKVNMDFSVNLNPLGPSEVVLKAVKDAVDKADVYPDSEQDKARTVIADTVGTRKENVIAGNGASELLMALVRALNPKKALLFEPVFSGYEYALRAVGAEIVRRAEDEKECDLIFICDPVNPTGACVKDSVLREILDAAKERGAVVCIDESFFLMSDRVLDENNLLMSNNFVDEGNHLMTDEAAGEGGCDKALDEGCSDRVRLIEKYINLVIIRSLTKFLCLPGIRMGYAVADKDLIARMRNQLPEWNLSVCSEAGIVAGMSLVRDSEFVLETARTIKREREFLTKGLRDLGYKVYDSCTSFVLIKASEDLYDRLLGFGILIRNCEDFVGLGRGYFRIAVKSRDENEKLLDVLRGFET